MKKFFTLACFILAAHVQFARAQRAAPIALGFTDTLYSSVLGEKRTLNIYLPEGYNDTDTARYPVIYLLDGGVDEDFIHIAGLAQFCAMPWVDRLPPSIIIGITNTDRKRDFTFPTSIKSEREKFPTTGGSARFIAFLEGSLQPYVQQRYRTTASRTIIGQSLGGLLAAEILLKKPQLFNQYIIVSPSLWWDDGSLLKQPMNTSGSATTDEIRVYLGVGKEGLAPSERPHVMEVDANLLAERLRAAQDKRLTLHFDYLPDEDHATILHAAVYNAFRKLRGNN